jgi:hypothetical protein
MSRVINPESAGKERNRLSKAIVIAIREFMKQPEPNETSKDIAAFIILSLEQIDQTIDLTVAPWEKRDYWVKADRFRMDWAWVKPAALNMRKYFQAQDWPQIAMQSIQIAQKFNNIKVSERHRMGTPWVGAYAAYKKELDF